MARLETAAGNLRLADVLTALEGTGFRLDLRRDTAEETDLEGGADAVDGVPSGSPWPVTDLVARDSRGLCFPPYRDVRHTPEGPRWWWPTASMPTTARPPMWSAEGPSEGQMESWVAEYRALQERRRRDAVHDGPGTGRHDSPGSYVGRLRRSVASVGCLGQSSTGFSAPVTRT